MDMRIDIKAEGAKESLDTVNEIIDKLKEAQSLIKELASKDIQITINGNIVTGSEAGVNG